MPKKEDTENTYLVLCIFLVPRTVLYFLILRTILSENLQTSILYRNGIKFVHKANEHDPSPSLFHFYVRYLSVAFLKGLFLIFKNIEHHSVLYILNLIWSCVMGLVSSVTCLGPCPLDSL